jgi:alkaline phosphatase D
MPQIDRRTLFKAGALGLAGATVPALARETGGFTHGVASGEPGPNRVLLWTRYQAVAAAALRWEVADSADFKRIVARGTTEASPERDCCAKAVATGLKPGKWYWYRFVAADGAQSPAGRTRTLPVGKVPKYRIAVFSCSNIGFGWFNAYAHACEADDFDLAVHLGDYFYEQRKDVYPKSAVAQPGRAEPLNEAVTLAGYRERLAVYRADPDLQRLHAQFPMIAIRDDHESANDAWSGGAENHQPATEGDWAARKTASERAYREWMPVSDDYYAAYEIGSLATLFRLETRHLARDKQLGLAAAYIAAKPGEQEAALVKFRDTVWPDPKRGLLGAAQETWLGAGLSRSTRARKPWQVLLQQVIMGRRVLPGIALEGVPTGFSPFYRAVLESSVAAGKINLPFSMDMWDGYPAARERLYELALTAKANLVVLAGDSHNGWAFEHDHKGARVGVEFAGTSVTSPGAEETLPWVNPAALAAAMVAANPQLTWCDTKQRGYLALELTPTAASGEYRFLQTIRERSTALAGTHKLSVGAGQRRFTRS